MKKENHTLSLFDYFPQNEKPLSLAWIPITKHIAKIKQILNKCVLTKQTNELTTKWIDTAFDVGSLPTSSALQDKQGRKK